MTLLSFRRDNGSLNHYLASRFAMLKLYNRTVFLYVLRFSYLR